jgi:hypothetical protein
MEQKNPNRAEARHEPIALAKGKAPDVNSSPANKTR